MIRFCLSTLVLCVFAATVVTLNQVVPNRYIDLTSFAHHQLNQTTQSLLKHLDEPLGITLYTQNPDIIRQVTFFVDSIQAYGDTTFSIEDKIPLPDEQEAFGFTTDGLTFSLNQQTQSLDLSQAHLDELAFSKILFKLTRRQDDWIAFMSGHGEPSISDETSKGYSLLAKALNQQGLNTVELDLPSVGFIADNTALLVLTSPKSNYLPKEITLIEEYLKQGGALLWLMDFQGQPLPFLSNLLGVRAYPGLIIDKQGHEMGTPHPAISIISQYPKGSLFAGNQLTAFPWAQALNLEPRAAFSKQVILQTHPESWTHITDINAEIEYSKERGEIQGPLDLGVILTRPQSNKTQKIIVVGNYRFASNAAIQNYGNLSITLKAMNTLVEAPELAQLAYNPPQDVIAILPKMYQQILLALMLILPGTLIALGFWVHLKSVRKSPVGLR